MFHEVSKQTRKNQKRLMGAALCGKTTTGRLYGKMRKRESDAMHFPAGIEHRFI